jgi:hypothetical protein
VETAAEEASGSAGGSENDQPDTTPSARDSARRLRAKIKKAEEPRAREPRAEDGRGAAIRANYGLILGILACVLFKLSSLLLILSIVGLWYSGRALWSGLYRRRIIVYRALVGLVLALISCGLHILESTGQLAAAFPFP